MIVGYTKEDIRFNNQLTLEKIKIFDKFKIQLENIYLSNQMHQDININGISFPGFCRPKSMCRWYISIRQDQLFYEDTCDDFIYVHKETTEEMISWLKYLLKYFFVPQKIVLNGKMTFFTEDDKQFSKILITNNTIDLKIYWLLE